MEEADRPVARLGSGTNLSGTDPVGTGPAPGTQWGIVRTESRATGKEAAAVRSGVALRKGKGGPEHVRSQESP